MSSGAGFGDGDRQNVSTVLAETKVAFLWNPTSPRWLKWSRPMAAISRAPRYGLGILMVFCFEEICLSYAVLFVILLLVGFLNEHGDAQEVKVF